MLVLITECRSIEATADVLTKVVSWVTHVLSLVLWRGTPGHQQWNSSQRGFMHESLQLCLPPSVDPTLYRTWLHLCSSLCSGNMNSIKPTDLKSYGVCALHWKRWNQQRPAVRPSGPTPRWCLGSVTESDDVSVFHARRQLGWAAAQHENKRISSHREESSLREVTHTQVRVFFLNFSWIQTAVQQTFRSWARTVRPVFAYKWIHVALPNNSGQI